MIAPKSIAIVGASETSFFGRTVLENLRRFGYAGQAFPINPRRAEILGVKCYPDLKSLPCSPDHVFLIVRGDMVRQAMEECHAVGAGGVSVVAAGFGETHTEKGVAMERQITAYALEKRLPTLGPNCLGVINTFDACYPFGSAMAGKLNVGNIGVTMQSGGMIGGMLRASWMRLGFGYCVSTGNEAVLETSDWIRYMAEDPKIEVICSYVEGFKSPGKFIEAAELALKHEKPLLVLKVGRTEAGRQAALAHTGSLAGSDEVIDSLFREYGVTRVSDFDEMIETAALFSTLGKKRPKGGGFAAVTASGGTRSMIADIAGPMGLTLPDLSPQTATRLRAVLPEFGSISNPLDATAQVLTDPQVYNEIMKALIDDPAVDIITVFQTLGFPGEDTPYHVRLLDIAMEEAPKSPKPITVAAVAAQSLSEWQRNYLKGKPGLVFTQGLSETLRGIQSVMTYEQRLQHFRRHGVSRSQPRPSAFTWRWGSSSVPGKPGLRAVTEYAAKAALRAYGIGVTREELARSAEEAAQAADRIGYPVVLKYISPDVLHKTDAGGVLLNLRTADEVRAGYDTVRSRVRQHAADAREEGVLVQEMLCDGAEAILGVVNDPQFGPAVMVGAGGIFVEALKDVAFAPAPVQRDDAQALVDRLKGKAMLTGLRGKGPYDIDALVDAIVALSRMAWDGQGVIEQVDINPLLVLPKGQGVKALDALFVIREE